MGPKDNNDSDTSRTIVAKFSSYKTKELILKKANQLKGTGYYINEDFSKETLETRKENWKKVKKLRESGKYAVLVYNKVVWKERNPTNSIIIIIIIAIIISALFYVSFIVMFLSRGTLT